MRKIVLLSAVLLGLISFQAVYAEGATSPNPTIAPSTPIQPQPGIPAQNPPDASAMNPTDNAAAMNPSDSNAITQPPAAPSEGLTPDSAPTDTDMSMAGVSDDKSGSIDSSATINSEPNAPVDAD